jgi:hypothetical protein
MYFLQDINTTQAGDLIVSANGDLELGDSFETIKSAVNFIARTDKGGYLPDIRIGGDLGAGIGGQMNKQTLMSMEASLRDNLAKFILNPSDFRVHVIPLTTEDVGVFVAIGGQYTDADGNLIDVTPEIISYSYPFLEGSPTPLPE